MKYFGKSRKDIERYIDTLKSKLEYLAITSEEQATLTELVELLQQMHFKTVDSHFSDFNWTESIFGIFMPKQYEEEMPKGYSHIGSLIVKTEEEPRADEIGWTVIERHGWTVYHYPDIETRSDREILDSRHWLRDEAGTPIFHKPVKTDQMKVGLEVIVKDNMFDYVYGRGTVSQSFDFKYIVENENNLVPLELSDDDRNCWVSSCVINKKALQVLNETT